MNARAGAASGLKTKAGWLGVDVGVGAVSLAAAGAAAAFAVGTMGAPVLAGVAVGIGASYVISGLAGMEIGGKSVTDHVKDGVQGVANGVKSGVETVVGWFK